MRRDVLLLAALTGCWVTTSVSLAEERPVVVLLDPGDASNDAGALLRAIQMQLLSLPVSPLLVSVDTLPADLPSQISMVRSAVDEHEAMAALWFDQPADSPGLVHLVGRDGYYIRVRELQDSSETVRAEEAALIVHSSIVALLAQRETGTATTVYPELPAAQVVEPPPPTQVRPRVLALRAAFTLASCSKNHAAQPGGDFGLGVHLGRNATLMIGYTLLPPMETTGERASARVVRHPARIELQASWSVGKLRLGPVVALELDYLTAEAVDLQPGLTTSGSAGDLVVSICPAVDLGIPLSNRLTLFAQVLASIPLNPHHYVVETAAGTELLMATWWVRPGVRVGLMVDLL